MPQAKDPPKTALEYMADHPDGQFCSRCGAEVSGAQGKACICWRCLDSLVRAWLAKTEPDPQPPERACADCGTERRAGKRYCNRCAAKRRRESTRRAVRQNRQIKRMAL